MANSSNRRRNVSTLGLKSLTQNSMEHLHLRMDDALSESSTAISGKSNDLTRLATFPDYVISGDSIGNFYKSFYKDDGDKIAFIATESINVPASTYQEHVDQVASSLIESMLSGESVSGRLAALMTMDENEGVEDLTTMVMDIVHTMTPWKTKFIEQYDNIVDQIGSDIERIEQSTLNNTYQPLYDGSIAEENFPKYLSVARRDCQNVGSRLQAIESKVERAYLPFASKAEGMNLPIGDQSAVNQFIEFSGALATEIRSLRECVDTAVKNEQCAMCLGQIYDSIVDNLNDYEIAGSFVEHMAVRLTNAKH